MQYVIVSKNIGLENITYLCIHLKVYSNESQRNIKGNEWKLPGIKGDKIGELRCSTCKGDGDLR